jgi:hypothetical protein
VANFVETEQLIFYAHHCFSFLQVRGSIPLFWSQSGVSSSLRLTRSIDASEPAFLLHKNYLENRYKLIILINLLSKKKEGENMLTEGVERLIQEVDEKDHKKNNITSYFSSGNERTKLIDRQSNVKEMNEGGLKYEYFDFHWACKGQKYENVDMLMQKIENQIKNLGFFGEKKGKVLIKQRGVVRINCLDCLDRTNAVMTQIAAVITQFTLEHLKLDLTKALGLKIIKIYICDISRIF